MRLEKLISGLLVLDSTASADMEISGVAYDSRAVKPGDLFVAVKGFQSDGHNYIPMAVEKGAAAVLCQQVPGADVPYILVEDSRLALALVSAAWFDHPADGMVMVGVTGTNGKTTTTTLLKEMLEADSGAKVGLLGTNKNMIGDLELPAERTTPESFELQKLLRDMADAGCSHVVMEVSSHSLVLSRVAGITFDLGVFTNLTQDHLDFHGTLENYLAAKAKLFEICRQGIVNLDDPAAETILKQAKCPVLTLSAKGKQADLLAENITFSAEKVSFNALYKGKTQAAELGIPGTFSVYNALTALACGLLLGMDEARAVRALAGCHGVKGRAEVVPTGRDYTVLIDYAHTPDALENILSAVRGFAKGRVIALFGCGGDRDRTKRPIMGRIAEDMADFVIVTSDNPRTEQPAAIIEDILAGMEKAEKRVVVEDRVQAIHWALDNAKKDDIIVLAGKGHETYQIVGTQKFHMDEREIVAEYLNK